MNNQIWRSVGNILTPPAFVMNIFCWWEVITVNKALTVVISLLVIVYWIDRIRVVPLKRKIKEWELKLKRESG